MPYLCSLDWSHCYSKGAKKRDVLQAQTRSYIICSPLDVLAILLALIIAHFEEGFSETGEAKLSQSISQGKR